MSSKGLLRQVIANALSKRGDHMKDMGLDAIINAIGINWQDPDLREKIRPTSSFNSPEYMDRPHFVGLKSREILQDYPEYIYNAPKDIVDVSCGNGICLEILRYLGHSVQGMDTSHTGFLNFPRSQNIPVIEFNGNELPIPLPDKSYDLLISVGAIHHYKANWGEVLDEFFRIARETVFISVSRGHSYSERCDELDLHPTRNRWVKKHTNSSSKYKFVYAK